MAIAEKVFSASGYHDLRAHIEALDREGLIYHIDHPVNKDTEIHPLVRWQYRGGIPDAQRKAFLFTNVVDSQGRKYSSPVLIGGLAGSRRIYAIGMQCTEAEIGPRWERALRSLGAGRVGRSRARARGRDRQGSARGDRGHHALPDADLDAGLRQRALPLQRALHNERPRHGRLQQPATIAACSSGAAKVAVQFSPHGADGAVHWEKYRRRGEHCPVAIVVGGPPVLAYTAVQRMPLEVDEIAVAGALVGAPLRFVKCKTVDLDGPGRC